MLGDVEPEGVRNPLKGYPKLSLTRYMGRSIGDRDFSYILDRLNQEAIALYIN